MQAGGRAVSSTFIPFGSRPFADASTEAPGRGVVHIVDDMAEQIKFLTVGLDQSGYRAVLHRTVQDFVASFTRVGAAAVVVDIRLGDGDAMDVLDHLKRTGALTLDIVLISGDPAALEHCRRYAEEIGLKVTKTLAKPFTAAQLVDKLTPPSTDLRAVVSQLDVDSACANGWIYPVLQPKLDLESGKIRSAELLSRVAHPEFGVIAPDVFIQTLDSAQSQALFLRNIGFAWQNFGYEQTRGGELAINVNIDGHSLARLRSQIQTLSQRSPSFFRNLVFEVTEEAMAQISDDDLKGLYKLTLDGAKFSIDDFGAGHANFARLSRLPFCEIKIDRSLIRQCHVSRPRQIVIRSIIGMAQDMGARVVAEGVETADELAFLTDAGCDETQGFLIARPMRLEKFRQFVREFNYGKPGVRPGGTTALRQEPLPSIRL